MLALAPAAVDGAAVVVSVTELAGIKGVSKQAVSKRIARFEAQGLIRTGSRRGKGNVVEKTVVLAEFDHAAGETSDPSKVQGHATRAAIAGESPAPTLDDAVAANVGGAAKAEADPSYTKELTRKAGYDADLKKMQLQQQRGELLEIADVQSAMERCAEAVVRDIDQLPAFADDLAAAVASGGVPALRELLKVKARELRERLRRSMTTLAIGQDDHEADDDALEDAA